MAPAGSPLHRLQQVYRDDENNNMTPQSIGSFPLPQRRPSGAQSVGAPERSMLGRSRSVSRRSSGISVVSASADIEYDHRSLGKQKIPSQFMRRPSFDNKTKGLKGSPETEKPSLGQFLERSVADGSDDDEVSCSSDEGTMFDMFDWSVSGNTKTRTRGLSSSRSLADLSSVRKHQDPVRRDMNLLKQKSFRGSKSLAGDLPNETSGKGKVTRSPQEQVDRARSLWRGEEEAAPSLNGVKNSELAPPFADESPNHRNGLLLSNSKSMRVPRSSTFDQLAEDDLQAGNGDSDPRASLLQKIEHVRALRRSSEELRMRASDRTMDSSGHSSHSHRRNHSSRSDRESDRHKSHRHLNETEGSGRMSRRTSSCETESSRKSHRSSKTDRERSHRRSSSSRLSSRSKSVRELPSDEKSRSHRHRHEDDEERRKRRSKSHSRRKEEKKHRERSKSRARKREHKEKRRSSKSERHHGEDEERRKHRHSRRSKSVSREKADEEKELRRRVRRSKSVAGHGESSRRRSSSRRHVDAGDLA